MAFRNSEGAFVLPPEEVQEEDSEEGSEPPDMVPGLEFGFFDWRSLII